MIPHFYENNSLNKINLSIFKLSYDVDFLKIDVGDIMWDLLL